MGQHAAPGEPFRGQGCINPAGFMRAVCFQLDILSTLL